MRMSIIWTKQNLGLSSRSRTNLMVPILNDHLILDLLQAMGITPPTAKISPFRTGQKRKKRPSNDEYSLQEEIKRLRARCLYFEANKQSDLSRLQRQRTEPLESSNTMSIKLKKVVIKKEIEIVDLTED